MANFPADMDIWYGLAHDGFIMGSEPLGRWMHWVFFRLTGSRTLALTLPSYLAGLIFAAGAWRVLKKMYSEEFTKAFVFVLLAPYSMFFLGYPSTCPLAYAFTGLYLLTGLAFIRSPSTRAPWAASLLLALAVWSHGMALWVTGAQLVLVVTWLRRLPVGGLAAVPRVIALCAMPFFRSWPRRFCTRTCTDRDSTPVPGTATPAGERVGRSLRGGALTRPCVSSGAGGCTAAVISWASGS